MVFNADLANMDPAQRQAAIDARDQAKAQAQNQPAAQRTNQPAGIAGLMGGGVRIMGGGGGGRQRQGGQQGQTAQTIVTRNLWFISGDGKLSLMRVRAGISDGTMTELLAEDDLEGRQVILREKI
jgi:hypothetical protein